MPDFLAAYTSWEAFIGALFGIAYSDIPQLIKFININVIRRIQSLFNDGIYKQYENIKDLDEPIRKLTEILLEKNIGVIPIDLLENENTGIYVIDKANNEIINNKNDEIKEYNAIVLKVRVIIMVISLDYVQGVIDLKEAKKRIKNLIEQIENDELTQETSWSTYILNKINEYKGRMLRSGPILGRGFILFFAVDLNEWLDTISNIVNILKSDLTTTMVNNSNIRHLIYNRAPYALSKLLSIAQYTGAMLVPTNIIEMYNLIENPGVPDFRLRDPEGNVLMGPINFNQYSEIINQYVPDVGWWETLSNVMGRMSRSQENQQILVEGQMQILSNIEEDSGNTIGWILEGIYYMMILTFLYHLLKLGTKNRHSSEQFQTMIENRSSSSSRRSGEIDILSEINESLQEQALIEDRRRANQLAIREEEEEEDELRMREYNGKAEAEGEFTAKFEAPISLERKYAECLVDWMKDLLDKKVDKKEIVNLMLE